ncbi:MAG TPA: nuclear transport factor 2 family protein [Blastocatellia bacterium]|nr:nuclear transport factor 2 family protein [Blastocatellia bacterium]
MDLTKLNEFGTRYAKAWCSQDPDSVAEFYAEDGSLTVNDGPPAVGRQAVADVARGFMSAFPDMEVTMDDLANESQGTAFHWTLTGTNTGPGGTGNRVRISGFELWTLDDKGLIKRSKGHFDGAEYERQLKYGVDG